MSNILSRILIVCQTAVNKHRLFIIVVHTVYSFSILNNKTLSSFQITAIVSDYAFIYLSAVLYDMVALPEIHGLRRSTKWCCDIINAFISAKYSYICFNFHFHSYCCEDVAHPVWSCSYFDTRPEATSSDFS